MRRLQKVAVLAVAVGSLSGVGAGVGVADSTPHQSQTLAQPPSVPAQIGLQQIAPVQNAPQQTAALQQATPLQTAAAQAVPDAAVPQQNTVQGFGQTSLPPALRSTTVAPASQSVVQSAMQT